LTSPSGKFTEISDHFTNFSKFVKTPSSVWVPTADPLRRPRGRGAAGGPRDGLLAPRHPLPRRPHLPRLPPGPPPPPRATWIGGGGLPLRPCGTWRLMTLVDGSLDGVLGLLISLSSLAGLQWNLFCHKKSQKIKLGDETGVFFHYCLFLRCHCGCTGNQVPPYPPLRTHRSVPIAALRRGPPPPVLGDDAGLRAARPPVPPSPECPDGRFGAQAGIVPSPKGFRSPSLFSIIGWLGLLGPRSVRWSPPHPSTYMQACLCPWL